MEGSHYGHYLIEVHQEPDNSHSGRGGVYLEKLAKGLNLDFNGKNFFLMHLMCTLRKCFHGAPVAFFNPISFSGI